MTQRNAQTKSILSKLFRQILLEQRIGPARFNVLVDAYLEDESKKQPPGSFGPYTQRAHNLIDELHSSEMSMDTFIKALKVLKLEKCEFGITAQDKNGKVVGAAALIDLVDSPLLENSHD